MTFFSRILFSMLVFTASPLFAGVIEGKTLDLAENPVGGVTIQAFEVDAQGNRSNVAFNSTVSSVTAATLGEYKLDLMNKPRVVLQLSGGGSNTIFLPEPSVPGTNRGGAMSGRKDIKNVDIIVPEAKPLQPCYERRGLLRRLTHR